MLDFAKEYPKQNSVLDVYLKNASIGIVVLECNNVVTGVQICEYLHTCYSLQMIDYNKLRHGIVDFLREIGNNYSEDERNFCIYNIPTNSDTVDVVKSLNISRELLKNAKRLVFVMPTLLVRQIQRYEPNLNDYIGLYLDCNKYSREMPFLPVFDVPFKKQFTKPEQAKLKREKIHLAPNPTLEQYFQYLDQFNQRKLSKYECTKILMPAFAQKWGEVSSRTWTNDTDATQAKLDVLYRTATILAIQQYYDAAERLFWNMLDVWGKRYKLTQELQVMQALEGLSYSHYYLGKYNLVKEGILLIIDILESNKSPMEAWICRLNSNYAACYIQEKNYAKAIELLENSYQRLRENDLLNLEREIRINTNRMICYMAEGKCADLHESEWIKTRERIEKDLGKDNVYYANNLLMHAWYKGILMGDNSAALEEASEALEINKRLLGENAYGLAVNYRVLQALYDQLGDEPNSMQAKKKCESILQNQRNL